MRSAQGLTPKPQMDTQGSGQIKPEKTVILIRIPKASDRQAKIASTLRKVDVQFQMAGKKHMAERSSDLAGVGAWAKD